MSGAAGRNRFGRTLAVGAVAFGLVLSGSTAEAKPSKGPFTGFKRIFGKVVKNTEKRVGLALQSPGKGYEPGFVPRFVLRDIIKNTSVDPSVLNAEQLRDNLMMVKAARHTLAKVPKQGKKAPRNGRNSDKPLSRLTYDANMQSKIPGTLELSETDNETGVDSAKRAHNAMKVFYELNKALGFNAMDIAPKQSGALEMTVRYNQMDNAYYDGTRMVLGAGSGGGLFKDLSLGDDVSFHEVGHGMTEHVLTAGNEAKSKIWKGKVGRFEGLRTMVGAQIGRTFRNVRARTGLAMSTSQLLEYRGQSGSLNESVSDIYGVMGLQYERNVKIKDLQETDWLIGHDVMSDNIKNDEGRPVALRNMLHPGTAYNDPRLGKDRQPDHMSKYDSSPYDNYGVHINSGIPNRAFANATLEFAKTEPEATTWTSTGKVWMHALALLGPNATFQEAADATYKMAKKMYADNPKMAAAIASGWDQVGIKVGEGVVAKKKSKTEKKTEPAMSAPSKIIKAPARWVGGVVSSVFGHRAPVAAAGMPRLVAVR